MNHERRLVFETLKSILQLELRTNFSHGFRNLCFFSIMLPGATCFVCEGGSSCLAADPIEEHAKISTADSGLAEDSDENLVKWLYNYDEAIARAKKLNRPVLIDFASSWCFPCVMMDKHVWPKIAVQEILANKVIPLRIDMDGKLSPPLIDKFKVEFVPTLLLIDSKGKELKREGYVNAKELTEMIKSKELGPETQE